MLLFDLQLHSTIAVEYRGKSATRTHELSDGIPLLCVLHVESRKPEKYYLIRFKKIAHRRVRSL